MPNLQDEGGAAEIISFISIVIIGIIVLLINHCNK